MNKKNRTYNDINHFYGRIFMSVAILVVIAIPFTMAFVLKTAPDYEHMFSGLLGLIIFIVGGFVEVITYAPLLGTSGTYLAFFTGNLVNLKVPCAVNSREQAGYLIGTKEAEVVSTISVGTSAIVTTVIIAIGVALLTPLTPILQNETLSPAFEMAFTALFGALAYKYFLKDLKLVPIPLVICILLQIFTKVGTSILIPVGAIITILFAYYLFKREKKKDTEKQKNIN